MPSSEHNLLFAIDKLYEAALEPSRWEDALDAVSQATGGIGAVLVPLSHPEKTVSSASLLDANAAYTREWSAFDTRSKSDFARGLRKTIVTDGDILTRADMARDPFYQEFLRSFDLEYFAAYLSTPAPGSIVSLSVQQALGKGPFEREQLDVLAKIGPHAARALALSARIGPREVEVQSDLVALVNRLDCGAIVVSRRGNVVALNANAEGFQGDGFTVTRRRLVASSCAGQSALDRLLHTAFNQESDNIGVLSLPRPSGNRPLVLQATPLAKEFFPGHLTKKPGFVLVLVFDLERGGGSSNSVALRSLGLTPAEVGVATLIGSGLSPQETSDDLGVSVDTVRTHLKNINLKLGLRRQGDLVRLVTRLQIVK